MSFNNKPCVDVDNDEVVDYRLKKKNRQKRSAKLKKMKKSS